MNEAQQHDPDVFSAELHFALLNEGLRGPAMRRLMRTARNDTELWRILETKVSEFRHYLRANRKPTLANLPLRAWEWVSDNARFTPPKEVFMTLIYVALAMVGVEVFKQHMSSEGATGEFPVRSTSSLDLISVAHASSNSDRTSSGIARIDQWMIDELTKAAESPAWRDALARHLAESIKKVDIGPMLSEKLGAAIDSPQLTNRINELVDRRIAEQIALSTGAEEELPDVPLDPTQIDLNTGDPALPVAPPKEADAPRVSRNKVAPSPTNIAKGSADR